MNTRILPCTLVWMMMLGLLGTENFFQGHATDKADGHAIATAGATETERAEGDDPLLAVAPPMGWNSWDGYGTTINEEQIKANAKWFAEHLKPLGWEYIVVDMEWSPKMATLFWTSAS